MYYQTNPQNQNQANYVQNYAYPTTNAHAQVVANNQYQYPTYTTQTNQLRAQPQLQNIQNVQPMQNYANTQIHQHHKVPKQNIQTVPQQIQTTQHIQTTKPAQNAQNIQYIKVPGQNNTYVPYTQPVQYVQPGQHNQYNIKTNVIDGKQQVKALLPNQVVNQVIQNQPKIIQNQPQVIQNQPQVIQNPNLVQTVQVTNQVVQPQANKLIFKAPKPLSTSHRNPQSPPSLGQVNVQNPPHTEIEKEYEQNQQVNNQNFTNNTTLMNNQTINPMENKNKVEPKFQMPVEDKSKQKKTASFMTVGSLAGLPYTNYPVAEFSKKPFLNISGYASNTYNGKIKNYNEDMVKVQYKVEKPYYVNGKEYRALISYFGIFDGHGGDACSKFLKANLDMILFNQTMFPNNIVESVRETFKTAESKFKQLAVHGSHLKDKSGSCAVISLIVNDILYSINLGDSRALYSKDSGNEFYQITRDHKPNDPIEQARIEKAGGKVYYANKTVINGKEVTLREEQFGPGFKFPYRLFPSGLAVVRTIGDYYSKDPIFKGIPGTNINMPVINVIKIDDKSDFVLLGCDGIFDRLENEKILRKIWEYKKAGQVIDNIHQLCVKIVDAIIKFSMQKDSVDNVSVIFIAFKNFENKMKDINFEYKQQTKCQNYPEQYDLSTM